MKNTLGVFAVLLLTATFGASQAHAAITSQLDLGAKGTQVTELQQFLASNPTIYPAGIVSGYFGSLTQAAVRQFQAAYDLPQVGRVGPMTGARINAVVNSGLGMDVFAPVISGVAIQTSTYSTTVSWSTDSQASGKVFYSTQPLQTQEASASFTAPAVSGSVVQSSLSGYAQSLMISNLLSNTTYYYLVEAIDNSGNVSVTLPNSFHTNQ